jgi:hypothetical protein
MSHGLWASSAVALIAALTGAPAASRSDEPGDPFAFFGPELRAPLQSASTQMARGEPAVQMLNESGKDVALLAAVPIAADGDRLAAWTQAVEQLQKGPYVRAIGRFSNPPVPDDLAELVLDSRDLDDLRRCRPGHCALKLSDDEIAKVRYAASSPAGWQAAVNEAFRGIVLDRAWRYRIHGVLGETYHDKKHPVAIDAVTAALAAPFCFLERYPAATRESFLYWSVEALGGRPTVAVIESTILTSREPGVPETVVMSRRVYANHYFEGAIAMTAIVRSERERYLVYFNRSRVDLIDGVWAGLIRRVIEHRVRDEAPGVLQALRRKLEGGLPRVPEA